MTGKPGIGSKKGVKKGPRPPEVGKKIGETRRIRNAERKAAKEAD